MSDTPYAQPHTPNQFDIRAGSRLVSIHFRCRISQGNPIRSSVRTAYCGLLNETTPPRWHVSPFIFFCCCWFHWDRINQNCTHAKSKREHCRAREKSERGNHTKQTNESDGYEIASIMSVNDCKLFWFPAAHSTESICSRWWLHTARVE